ncbi:predicted protein [Lichtheimia corymbifera JMRC:FSU:9682]|uniref:F-box domain-containing protein n=1 Tax=Lichtheimia corymbifera JMRC:FSU:9682 TaxID=1263082 RepID=A0A068RHH3_9FUNG|nr:predicted protein [Lichtheimia corymbifera JMRC:FSU:9682]
MPFLKRIAPYIKDLHTKHDCYDDDEDYEDDKDGQLLVDPTHLEMLTSLPLPQLRTLRYECWGLQLTALEGLLIHFGDRLQRLNVRVIYRSDCPDKPPCFCMFFRYCPQLKHLSYITLPIDMIMCAHGSQQQIVYPLESLELERHKFSMTKILPLLHQCPQLRRLCLSSHRKWDVDWLRILEICPELQSLEVILNIEARNRERDRLFWWGKHFILRNSNIHHSSTPGLLNLIITNLSYAHQFYALNTVVNLHHQTIQHIEVAFHYEHTVNTGGNHDPILVAPPNLEKLDFHFYDFPYTADDLTCVIRPYLDQCSRLTWVSLKTHRSNYLTPLPRWAFVALAQLSDLRHLHIQMPNDPNNMVYFLDTIKSYNNNTKLESLFYDGDWVSNMDVIRLIAELPSLRSLALSLLPASIDQYVPPKAMIDCLQLLQHAPRIQSLSFTNVNGFGSQDVFHNMGLIPHLQRLYIITYASTSKEGIRHIADREPPLKILVVGDMSDPGEHMRDFDFEDALEYARTKIEIVEGEYDCGTCCREISAGIAYTYGLY